MEREENAEECWISLRLGRSVATNHCRAISRHRLRPVVRHFSRPAVARIRRSVARYRSHDGIVEDAKYPPTIVFRSHFLIKYVSRDIAKRDSRILEEREKIRPKTIQTNVSKFVPLTEGDQITFKCLYDRMIVKKNYFTVEI